MESLFFVLCVSPPLLFSYFLEFFFSFFFALVSHSRHARYFVVLVYVNPHLYVCESVCVIHVVTSRTVFLLDLMGFLVQI